MKAKELRQLTAEELSQKAQEARADLFSARVQHSTGQLENKAKLRDLRRELARVQTILCERHEAKK
jgi:large subunit ribosomal protein L29